MNPTESFLVLLLAGLATAVALGVIEVSPVILHSSVSQTFLLVMSLVLFAYSPVVGIAAIAFFAILMFKRNVQKTTQYTKVAQEFAKESKKMQEYTTMPYASVVQPRQYETQLHSMQQKQTNYNNNNNNNNKPWQQPLPEGFMDGYTAPEEVGTYPLGDSRPVAETGEQLTAMYRPSEDMGDNTFIRSGPNIDEKMQSFAY